MSITISKTEYERLLKVEEDTKYSAKCPYTKEDVMDFIKQYIGEEEEFHHPDTTYPRMYPAIPPTNFNGYEDEMCDYFLMKAVRYIESNFECESDEGAGWYSQLKYAIYEGNEWGCDDPEDHPYFYRCNVKNEIRFSKFDIPEVREVKRTDGEGTITTYISQDGMDELHDVSSTGFLKEYEEDNHRWEFDLAGGGSHAHGLYYYPHTDKWFCWDIVAGYNEYEKAEAPCILIGATKGDGRYMTYENQPNERDYWVMDKDFMDNYTLNVRQK
jgi:hypothetical protein